MDPNAIIPNSGDFMNQFGDVRPTVQPSWVLKDFDIDKVGVGSEGDGQMDDNDGTFPKGTFRWRVLSRL
ncbi:hypothetical protein [Sabulicella glaciei]|nr:hypothetical protein [Roseococcus sp. MDT2-1-1]